jgi:hypothetical protein
MERQISPENLNEFKNWLQSEERNPGTIEHYLRDVLTFAVWLDSREVGNALMTDWNHVPLCPTIRP